MARWIFIFLIIAAAGCQQPQAGVTRSGAEAAVTPTPTTTATPTATPSPPATISMPPTLTAVTVSTPIQPTPILTPLTISADNANIHYQGRFDLRNPAEPIFDWSGVVIEAKFTGSSIAALLESGHNIFNVSIDAKTQILTTTPEESLYLLAENLTPGDHHVRIVKRTEAQVGRAAFRGFVLDGGGKLLAPPPPAARRIEFIGDSITAGYGNEGDSPTCFFTPLTQNAEATYAAQTAVYFDADYTLLALSGLGIVRNFDRAAALSGATAVDYFSRTVALYPGLTWDFGQWTPDAVVINLGTNDFSTEPFPEQELFVDGYTNLIRAVHTQYPDAAIFATAGPILFADVWWYVETAVTRARQQLNFENIHYVPIENNLELSGVDYGCDLHPNVNGHQKIADQLIPVMAEKLGW